jgi:uncharacterized RDD family membrane protein YckC
LYTVESIRIDTAQNVALHYEVASFGDRIVAQLLDGLVMFAWWIALISVVGILGMRHMSALWLLWAVPFFFYHLICELIMNGQSVGKRIMKLRVVRADGQQAGIGAYLLRWLLRPVDMMLFIGVVAILATDKGQRLGDLAAGTVLVSVKARRTLAESLIVTAPENHQVRYANAHLLTDVQAQLMKDVLIRSTKGSGQRVVSELAAKVRLAIGADGQEEDRAFLQTVLRDHTWLTSR